MLMLDIDTEYQTQLPNQAAGVLSPGPGIIIGSGTGDDIGTEFLSDENTNNITARIVGGGSFSLQGRTELDPVLNELIYVIPSEEQRARLVSQTLLKDVTVLQIGDFKFPALEAYEREQERIAAAQIETAADPNNQQQTGQQQEEPVVEDTGPAPPDVITLVVTPQEAVTLNYMMYAGAELTLALRAAGDDSSIDTEAATLQFLLDTYNIPVPAKLPYGMEPSTNELVAPSMEDSPVQTGQQE
jgi:pilus assembly protein CpaB